jgi:hypothetical protein
VKTERAVGRKLTEYREIELKPSKNRTMPVRDNLSFLYEFTIFFS